MDTVPLEGAYLITAIACALIGFIAMRWHGLTRGAGSFRVGGFFYVLGRASLVAGLIVVTWKQVLKFDVSMETSQSLAYNAFLIGVLGLMALTSALMLAGNVFLNTFGSDNGAARP